MLATESRYDTARPACGLNHASDGGPVTLTNQKPRFTLQDCPVRHQLGYVVT